MKRGQGKRPRTILDDYLIRILNALSEKDYTMLELAKKVGVNYQHLPLRLNPLAKDKIISFDRSAPGRTVIIKLKEEYKDVAYSLDPTTTTKKFLDFMVKLKKDLEFSHDMMKAVCKKFGISDAKLKNILKKKK